MLGFAAAGRPKIRVAPDCLSDQIERVAIALQLQQPVDIVGGYALQLAGIAPTRQAHAQPAKVLGAIKPRDLSHSISILVAFACAPSLTLVEGQVNDLFILLQVLTALACSFTPFGRMPGLYPPIRSAGRTRPRPAC